MNSTTVNVHPAEVTRQLNNEILDTLRDRHRFGPSLSFRAIDNDYFGPQFYEAEVDGEYACRWSMAKFGAATIYLPIDRSHEKRVSIYGRFAPEVDFSSIGLAIDSSAVAADFDNRGGGAVVITAKMPKLLERSVSVVSIINKEWASREKRVRNVFFGVEALSVD